MKTAERRVDEHWVVEVVDPRNLEMGWEGYTKRFTFVGDDAALEAWTCVQRAEQAGFRARSEKVKRV